MVHGQAAQKPTANHISECVCLKLYKLYLQARDRPLDVAGKRLPIPQAIVRRYTYIKMLLEDSQNVCGNTNIVLVTINNTTVSAW